VKCEDSVLRRLARFGALAVCLAAAPMAQPRASAGSPDPPRVRATAPPSRSTSILGAAWNADDSPIAGARLRLRNGITGRIEATTVANAAGQFSFANVEGGT
jgi:hypothetical protein